MSLKTHAKLYASISKTEAQEDGTLKVWGYASTGAVDSDGETITADAMKAALPDYMLWGAVREMHQSKAAGTALEASVEADGRTFFGCHVVDSEAVKKVNAGVYKGFSIGGKVTERDTLNKTIIKGIKLIEVSLVDRPANPGAVFTVIKCETERTAEDDVTDLADLINKGEVSPADLLALVKASKTAADASTVADEASAAADAASDAAEDASDKADSSDNTDDDQAASDAHQDAATAHYKAAGLTTSKVAKKKHNRKASMHQSQAWQMSAKAASADDLQKAGKTISEASMAQLKKAHDALAQLGCCTATDAEKLAKAHEHDELSKVQADLSTATEALAKAESEVARLKAAPAVGKAFLKAVAVGKEADTNSATPPADAPASLTTDPLELIKAAQKNPRIIAMR